MHGPPIVHGPPRGFPPHRGMPPFFPPGFKLQPGQQYTSIGYNKTNNLPYTSDNNQTGQPYVADNNQTGQPYIADNNQIGEPYVTDNNQIGEPYVANNNQIDEPYVADNNQTDEPYVVDNNQGGESYNSNEQNNQIIPNQIPSQHQIDPNINNQNMTDSYTNNPDYNKPTPIYPNENYKDNQNFIDPNGNQNFIAPPTPTQSQISDQSLSMNQINPNLGYSFDNNNNPQLSPLIDSNIQQSTNSALNNQGINNNNT